MVSSIQPYGHARLLPCLDFIFLLLSGNGRIAWIGDAGMACATRIRWVSLLTLWTNCPSIEQALEGLLASCNWSNSAGLVDAANITMNESVVVALLVVNSAWTDDDCFLVHFPVEKHKPNAVFFYSCLVDIFFRGQVGTLNEPCLPSYESNRVPTCLHSMASPSSSGWSWTATPPYQPNKQTVIRRFCGETGEHVRPAERLDFCSKLEICLQVKQKKRGRQWELNSQ
jgi:hypothetical protein